MEKLKNQTELRRNATKPRVVFTGGHAGTTAIATIEAALKKRVNWEIYWIGPKKTFEGKDIASYHSKVFPKLGVNYKGINTGRLQRKLSFWTIPSILKIPLGFAQAFYLILRIRPKVVVSFGGYVAFPVVFSSWVLGIPVIIHEQTMAAGLANKLSSYFARKIALARVESEAYYPKFKTEVIGNPVMSGILSVKHKSKMGRPPTVYVTGGSSGAQTINKAVDAVLEKILSSYKVIHHVGELDFTHFEGRKERLPSSLKERYEVYSFIDPQEIGRIYEKADILISRAGANTVSEIMVTGRPSIIVPIPWSRYDEQAKNAKLAQSVGIALVILQDELTGERLLEELGKIEKNWEEMVKNMDNTLADLDSSASLRLVNLIQRYISEASFSKLK